MWSIQPRAAVNALRLCNEPWRLTLAIPAAIEEMSLRMCTVGRKKGSRDVILLYKDMHHPRLRRLALLLQNGCCAVCGEPFPADADIQKDMYADHNHETGEFRGLVHPSCNATIGALEQLDPVRIRYLLEVYMKRQVWIPPRMMFFEVEGVD